MNISQLMRSLIGSDLRMNDAKALDLKVGQIIKGMALQLLDNEEALLRIEGLMIKAKLETPLRPGQMTLLQVQPESTSSLLVLKPLSQSQVPIANESLGAMLKEYGLKDQAAHRQLLQQMHQDGIPINKENVRQLASILSRVPESIPMNQWIQSGVFAFPKNIPLSTMSLQSVHQVLFGQPVHQMLEQLQGLTNQSILANANPSTPQAPVNSPTPLQALMQQLQTVLQQIQAATQAPSSTAQSSTHMQNASVQLSDGSIARPVAMPGQTSTLGGGTQSSGQANLTQVPTAAQPTQTSTTPQQVMSQQMSSEGAQQQSKAVSSPVANSDRTASAIQPTVANPTPTNSGEAPLPTATASRDQSSWISQLLRMMGVEHEQQMLKQLDKPEFLQNRQAQQFMRGDNTAFDPLLAARVPVELQAPTQSASWESLKSILMQLQAHDDLPAPLRESSQQLLQQITGQQLLMAADRGSQFSHFTVFIPLHDENGAQTAAINIQSRKNNQGGVDASNCRLLFDLHMKTLGDTLVDVQVVDKIVSLQVHNDHPMTGELLSTARKQISEVMLDLGYQMSSIKCTPFPEVSPAPSVDSESTRTMQTVNNIYSSKPYKGVDIRI